MSHGIAIAIAQQRRQVAAEAVVIEGAGQRVEAGFALDLGFRLHLMGEAKIDTEQQVRTLAGQLRDAPGQTQRQAGLQILAAAGQRHRIARLDGVPFGGAVAGIADLVQCRHVGPEILFIATEQFVRSLAVEQHRDAVLLGQLEDAELGVLAA